jgi:hypothetical protein
MVLLDSDIEDNINMVPSYNVDSKDYDNKQVYLTKPQQAEIATYTLFFLILFGLFRPMISNKIMDANYSIIMTVCFFVWYLMSKFFTNMIINNS